MKKQIITLLRLRMRRKLLTDIVNCINFYSQDLQNHRISMYTYLKIYFNHEEFFFRNSIDSMNYEYFFQKIKPIIEIRSIIFNKIYLAYQS